MLGDDCELYFARFNVIDSVGKIALPINNLLRWNAVLDRPAPTEASNVPSSNGAGFLNACAGAAFGGVPGAFRGPDFLFSIVAEPALTFPIHLSCSP